MELGGWGCKEDLGEAGIGENVIRLYSMKNTFSIINKILKSNCLDHSKILKQKKIKPHAYGMGESILCKWFLLPKLIYIFNTVPIQSFIELKGHTHTPTHT